MFPPKHGARRTLPLGVSSCRRDAQGGGREVFVSAVAGDGGEKRASERERV